MNNDLTNGPVFKTLIKFCWPLILSNLLMTLYNLADIMMAGHFLGKEAMSAIAAGGQLSLFLTALSTGLSAGGQILISRHKGASDTNAVRETVGTLLISTAIAGVLFAALGYFVSQPVLKLLNTPSEAFDQAVKYMKLTSLGLIFVFMYNSLSGIFRGLGDSIRPLLFILASAVLNVLLNYFFLSVARMDILGVSLSTVIAQLISCVLALIALTRKRAAFCIEGKFRQLRLRRGRLLGLVKVGIPFAAQLAVIDLANIFITSSINTYGVNASAALGAGVRITNVLLVPMMAVGNGTTTLVGQSMGGGKPERAERSVKCGLIITVCISAITIAICQLLPGKLIGLFNSDPEVISIGEGYLTTMSWCFIGHSCHSAYNAAALGVGFSAYSLFSSTCEAVFGRFLLTWCFGNLWGLMGIFIAQAAAPYISALLAGIYYYSGKWKKREAP